jgi:aminoglycoside phosphotransferase (APT) family kinase protein
VVRGDDGIEYVLDWEFSAYGDPSWDLALCNTRESNFYVTERQTLDPAFDQSKFKDRMQLMRLTKGLELLAASIAQMAIKEDEYTILARQRASSFLLEKINGNKEQ